MNWIKECLSSDSKVSSKRLITFAAFILMAIGYISNLYFDFKVDESMSESVKWIVMTGLGTVASEQFKKRGDNKNTPST